ncbi:tetratricopeptide repeat protein [Streptomyces mirabilis]|uniref:tetratricopeptide repeat protein n=1 Tax=Streptomyces mirabilis TaxID=68239 RepID=UPI0036AE243A
MEQVVADHERLLGAEHPDTLTARNNLGASYWRAGRTGEAIPLLEQVVADHERLQGTQHPNTLMARTNLAHAYHKAGRTGEAIPLLEQVVADHERLQGAEHPDIVRAVNALRTWRRARAPRGWLQRLLIRLGSAR